LRLAATTIGQAPRKPGASRIERMLAKIEATLVPPRRKWLRVIVEGDDEVAEAKKKGRCSPSMWPAILKTPRCTVEDFNWIELTLVRPRVATDG
jgi:hypothetical protein